MRCRKIRHHRNPADRRSPDGPRRKRLPDAAQAPGRGRRQPRLVAQSAQPEDPAEEPRRHQPAGRGLRLRRGGAEPRRGRPARRRRRGDARLAGLVARRLRPLRSAVHPDGVARRGHLPRQRRPRWRRRRHAALRPAQQLARQRQPGQGPPAAVAGQEEVRQEPVLGRPDRLRRQRRTGGHGLRRPRASPSVARTAGSPRRTSTGVPSSSGSTTSATPAHGIWRTRWPRSRWV